MSTTPTNPEKVRLLRNDAYPNVWHRWGPYLSERQWGTVREDYSADGAAWDYFTHDMARSRAYRWGEDGIGGWGDRHGIFCMSVAFWNGKDPILKERFFGLTNSEGNHGEDVKECYWYVDGTPTHSYMRMLYKYPQSAFPYEKLIQENQAAGRMNPEVELEDLGAFDNDRYFDIEIEYAKPSPDETYARVTIHNRADHDAPIWVVPQAWFRNNWAWRRGTLKPDLRQSGQSKVHIQHPRYGAMSLGFESDSTLLFTENESNHERLFGSANQQPYVKDAFDRFIIHKQVSAVNHAFMGTKVGALQSVVISAKSSYSLCFTLRLGDADFDPEAGSTIDRLRAEADSFYADLAPGLEPQVALVQRQAFAGLLWSKQFYHYDVRRWLEGDPDEPTPPAGRCRNAEWKNVQTAEVISMPDKWEYPWFAAWDLAFHCISFALIDPLFAKGQLTLLMREWYQHPNGQIPAYEWSFSDVNPPVHAWAALRVYRIDQKASGRGDVTFLKKAFHKLLLNFTWWVNRKDAQGNNIFEGGFLGLDNIGVFDRNRHLPPGYRLEQSDATSWMAMFCLNMLEIALEIAQVDDSYEDVASKFFEHFMYVATALNNRSVDGITLWDEDDGFYYDVLLHPEGACEQLKVRSMVGLIPLFAVTTLEPALLAKFPAFNRRVQWFLDMRPDLTMNVASMQAPGMEQRLLLSAVGKDRLHRIMSRMLNEDEFLSPYGVRSVSRYHAHAPFMINLGGEWFSIDYEPAESTSGSFGGNSNWRGPVWFPLNYLLIEALQKFNYYHGDGFQTDLPSQNGMAMNLGNVAASLEMRMLKVFLPDEHGNRPCNGGNSRANHDPYWKDLVYFNEYFHGDSGKGLGANHQTGWTGVIAKVIQQLYITAPDMLVDG